MEAMNKEKKFDILDWNNTKVNGRYLPLQKNAIDCGVFVCQYAECFSRDVWPTFSHEDMPVFRRRMVVELATGKLLPP
jgi:sentrin-specific protease 1